jgi:hypothetical protein
MYVRKALATVLSIWSLHVFFLSKMKPRYITYMISVRSGEIDRLSQSQSYFTTGGLPPISSSWRRAPWNSRPDFFFSIEHLRPQSLYNILSEERMGLSFIIAAGPHQSIHSRVRVPWDSRPYFTVSDSRLPFSSPPTTRRVTVEVFDPASTRERSLEFSFPRSSCSSAPWKEILNNRKQRQKTARLHLSQYGVLPKCHYINQLFGSRDSSVSMVTKQRAGRSGYQCLIPGRDVRFFCSYSTLDRL